MKKAIITLVMLVAMPYVLADYGDMMGYNSYGMMGGGLWAGLLALLWIVLASFIFSWIFWSTKKAFQKGKIKK